MLPGSEEVWSRAEDDDLRSIEDLAPGSAGVPEQEKSGAREPASMSG